MKWLFKWVLRLVILAIVLVVALILTRDVLLRNALEQEIREQTGMDAKIGKCSSSLFAPVFTLENLKLYNTADFGGTPFLDAPEIHFEFDPAALAQQKLHITLMRCTIKEIGIVKNEAGQTNLLNLLGKASAQYVKSGGLRVKGRRLVFDRIDVLNLSLGTARFYDLKNSRNNHDAHVNMQEVFREVKAENDLDGILAMIWLRSGGTFTMKAEVAATPKAPRPPAEKPVAPVKKK